MNNYFRIEPEPINKKDITESLQLAIRLSRKCKLAEVTIFTQYPIEIIKFLDGVIPGRDSKKLVEGETVQYLAANISYSSTVAIDKTKKYGVILAIDCLPDRGEAATRNYEYQIILTSVSQDDYSLPIDYWIRDANPIKF